MWTKFNETSTLTSNCVLYLYTLQYITIYDIIIKKTFHKKNIDIIPTSWVILYINNRNPCKSKYPTAK